MAKGDLQQIQQNLLELLTKYEDRGKLLDRINDTVVAGFSGLVDRMSVLTVRDDKILFSYVRDPAQKDILEDRWLTPWASLEGIVINSVPPQGLVASPKHPLYYAQTARVTRTKIHWLAIHPLAFMGKTFGCLEFLCRKKPGQNENASMKNIVNLLTPFLYNDETAKKLREVAHDIRNHMGIIIGSRQTIEPYIKDEVAREFYELAIENAIFTAETCSRILGKTQTDIVYGSVNVALEHCIKCLRTMSSGIDYEERLQQVPSINYDSRRLAKEVFLNIGIDCLHAFTERRIEKPWLCIESFAEGKNVFATFSDNAGGIPDEVKATLFDLNLSIRTGRGYGLGIAREIVYAHGGDMKLEDIKTLRGRGTKFVVQLPVSYVPAL